MTITSSPPDSSPTLQTPEAAVLPEQRRHAMQVRKRNGDTETVDLNKIVKAVERWVTDLDRVDPLRVATKTISGLYDGATTAELDKLSIQTAAELTGEEPQYSKLAARLLAAFVAEPAPEAEADLDHPTGHRHSNQSG
jgi:ribonucleoside-diphosphate reductase alpha chain